MVTRGIETRATDDLTPRQVQVMKLIAAGRTNFQIAESLGVSLDGAKYHVREILSKYGVASREDAVGVWQSGARQRRWRWAGGLGMSFAKLAVIGAIVGVVAAIAVSLLMIFFSGGDDSDPAGPVTETPAAPASASPAASPSASPSSAPETILGIDVKPLTLAEPAPLPEGLALYLETGCWQCDAPAVSLERVYRAPDGEVRIEDLFRIPGATLQQADVDGKYITSMSFDYYAKDILLAVCEGPYCGGVGQIADGATVTIRHSEDGGLTWTQGAPIDGGVWLRSNSRGGGADPGSGLISRIHKPAGAADFVTEFAYYPTLNTEPIELRGQDPASAVILDSSNGPPLLRGEDGVTFSRLEGSSTNPASPDFSMLPEGSLVVDLQRISNGMLVTWTSSEGAMYTGMASGDQPQPQFSEIFRWPDDKQPFFHRPQGGVPTSRSFVIAVSMGGGNVPAIIDFDAATITPVEELVERGEAGDRLLVKEAVGTGPFARVSGAGEGDCLNVRESPSLSAAAFACYADGVLLPELGQRTDADGHSWVLVDTPLNRQGWAASEFLETSGSAPSLASYPAGTRTGIAEVDPVIAALEESSNVSQDLIAWQQVECMAPPIQGLGGPPECPEGVADGTPLEVISGAACHGYWRIRPDDGSAVQLAVGPNDRLYAVARANPDDTFPPGADYVIIYAMGDRPEWGKRVHVADGRLVGDAGGCGTSPVDMLARYGDVVFRPPAP